MSAPVYTLTESAVMNCPDENGLQMLRLPAGTRLVGEPAYTSLERAFDEQRRSITQYQREAGDREAALQTQVNRNDALEKDLAAAHKAVIQCNEDRLRLLGHHRYGEGNWSGGWNLTPGQVFVNPVDHRDSTIAVQKDLIEHLARPDEKGETVWKSVYNTIYANWRKAERELSEFRAMTRNYTNVCLSGRVQELEAQVTSLQTVGTEQVEKIRTLEQEKRGLIEERERWVRRFHHVNGQSVMNLVAERDDLVGRYTNLKKELRSASTAYTLIKAREAQLEQTLANAQTERDRLHTIVTKIREAL